MHAGRAFPACMGEGGGWGGRDILSTALNLVSHLIWNNSRCSMTKMSNELENHCVKKSSVESGQVHRPRILPPWDAEAGRSQTQTEHTQLGKTFHQGKDKRGLGIVDVCLSGMQEAWGVCGGGAQCALGNPEKPIQYAVPIYLSEHLSFTGYLGIVVWKPWSLIPPHPSLTTMTFYQWLSLITERDARKLVPQMCWERRHRG